MRPVTLDEGSCSPNITGHAVFVLGEGRLLRMLLHYTTILQYACTDMMYSRSFMATLNLNFERRQVVTYHDNRCNSLYFQWQFIMLHRHAWYWQPMADRFPISSWSVWIIDVHLYRDSIIMFKGEDIDLRETGHASCHPMPNDDFRFWLAKSVKVDIFPLFGIMSVMLCTFWRHQWCYSDDRHIPTRFESKHFSTVWKGSNTENVSIWWRHHDVKWHQWQMSFLEVVEIVCQPMC